MIRLNPALAPEGIAGARRGVTPLDPATNRLGLLGEHLRALTAGQAVNIVRLTWRRNVAGARLLGYSLYRIAPGGRPC